MLFLLFCKRCTVNSDGDDDDDDDDEPSKVNIRRKLPSFLDHRVYRDGSHDKILQFEVLNLYECRLFYSLCLLL